MDIDLETHVKAPRDHLLNRRTYDIPGVRLAAFERGRRLAAWRDQASARASAR